MQNFHHNGYCPIRDVLGCLGDRWSMLVLVTLHANGVMRFSEVQRSLADVSQRMLTVTLRALEADGMIARAVYAEVPPRVEYALTDRGRSLMPHILALVAWAQEHMEAIFADRAGRESGLSK